MISHRLLGKILLGGTLLIAAGFGAATNATELIFSRADNYYLFLQEHFTPPGAYGQRVSAEIQDGFLYSLAYGATPNVDIVYGPDGDSKFNGWGAITTFGDLENVIVGDSDVDTTWEISLLADPGFQVQLHGFDLAAEFNSTGLQSVSVLSGDDTVLYHVQGTRASPVRIVGGQQHTSFDFPNPLQAETLRLRFGMFDNRYSDVGLDNLAFSQVQVPEPASALLLLAVGIAVGLGRRSRN